MGSKSTPYCTQFSFYKEMKADPAFISGATDINLSKVKTDWEGKNERRRRSFSEIDNNKAYNLGYV